MTNYKSLSQYVQEQMELFNIPDTEHNLYKIRIKCTRVLQELNLWDNAKTKLIGKKYTKIFSSEDLTQLSAKIRPYILKQSGLAENVFENYLQQANNYRDDVLQNQSLSHIDITNSEIVTTMVTALFNQYFEPLDIQRWTRDKETMLRKNLTDEEYALTMKRLLNPVKPC